MESKALLGGTWQHAGMPPWLMNPFLSIDDKLEDVRAKSYVLKMCLVGSAALCVAVVLRHAVPLTTEGEADDAWIAADIMAAYAFLVFCACVIYMYLWGLTRFLKVFFILNASCWLTMVAVSDSVGNWHFLYILILDFCLVVHSDRDEVLLERLTVVMRIAIVVFVALHVLSLSGLGPNIHLMEYGWSYNPLTQFICATIPTLMNFSIFRSFAISSRRDARVVHESVELATHIAEKLVNFDLDAAAELLDRTNFESPMHRPLSGLLRNLRSYQPFLPHSLFHHHSNSSEEHDIPNETLAKAMCHELPSWEHVMRAVARLRDPGYSLRDYHSDVEAAFPELKLYNLGNDDRTTRCSSGLTGAEEHQRTLGAFYSLYCMVRLDIDGKEIFTFGVDEQWKPRRSPHGDGRDRMQTFYRTMEWDKVRGLLLRAGILSQDCRHVGGLRLNGDRTTALLVLTAIHDVMKNPLLLPTVQKCHAPYEGIPEGGRISDHDVALAYVMENYPSLLPSFQRLEPGQRAPLLFAHGKMGFNNGWLVQGEAPPGALFSTFKKIIVQGRASESDISFYFAHWLTDVAGAELFNARPWPGSEKFVLKFPQKVLVAFLESFAFVDNLAIKTEVEVMEDYLRSRWAALGPPVEALEEGCELAAMRLALMAQGFEAAAVKAFLQLPESERTVIAAEMARTGLRLQFSGAPQYLQAKPTGPAFLVYYAPALIQKAGPDHASEALRVLAAVYRAAREVFPSQTRRNSVEQTVVVRIDALKVLTPVEIADSGSWHLRRTSEFDLEVVGGAPREEEEQPIFRSVDSSAISMVEIDMPPLGNAVKQGKPSGGNGTALSPSWQVAIGRRSVAV